VPAKARRKPAERRRRSQKGSVPKMSRNEGRKIVTRAMVASAHLLVLFAQLTGSLDPSG